MADLDLLLPMPKKTDLTDDELTAIIADAPSARDAINGLLSAYKSLREHHISETTLLLAKLRAARDLGQELAALLETYDSRSGS